MSALIHNLLSWVKVLEMAEQCFQLEREERLERFFFVSLIFRFELLKSDNPQLKSCDFIFSGFPLLSCSLASGDALRQSRR